MTFIEEHEYYSYAKKCAPIYKVVAPYGINNLMLNLLHSKYGFKIITRSGEEDKIKEIIPTRRFELQTWNNMHAKLWIGVNGALFGSWNFNLEHEKKATLRELVKFVPPSTKEYSELNTIFDEWWERARGNDIGKP